MVMVSLERERKLQSRFRCLVGCLDTKVSMLGAGGGSTYLSYTIKNGSNGLAASATCVTMRN